MLLGTCYSSKLPPWPFLPQGRTLGHWGGLSAMSSKWLKKKQGTYCRWSLTNLKLKFYLLISPVRAYFVNIDDVIALSDSNLCVVRGEVNRPDYIRFLPLIWGFSRKFISFPSLVVVELDWLWNRIRKSTYPVCCGASKFFPVGTPR
jgi:hypothetical protein